MTMFSFFLYKTVFQITIIFANNGQFRSNKRICEEFGYIQEFNEAKDTILKKKHGYLILNNQNDIPDEQRVVTNICYENNELPVFIIKSL